MNYFTPKMCGVFLILSYSSLVSCSVYYTTQEVDKNLKSTVNMAAATITHLQSQLVTMKSQYTEIPCDQKTPQLAKADQMLEQLDGQVNKIVQMQDTMKQVYQAFVRDNKGKEKIQSGTAEWTKLKHTKKTMKAGLKDLEEQGEYAVQLATTFHQYVIHSVVPTLSVCDVDARTAQFSTALANLSKDQADAQKQLKNYEAQIALVAQQFGTAHPQKCEQLYLHLDTIASHVAQITRVTQDVQKGIDTFKRQTKGIKKLYSCQSQWGYVEELQKAVVKQQKEISDIEKNIQKQHSVMQEILLSFAP
jgi:hypothetical protein